MKSANKYTNMPFIPYAIINKLAKSGNEDLWKALYYDTYDCLSKPNLTLQQKMSLVWKNQTDEEKYRVFLKPLITSEITKTMTQLRLYQFNIKPENIYKGIINYQFVILTGDKIALIDLDGVPVSRIDFIEQQLIKELNKQDLGLDGVIDLQFNRELDRNNQIMLNISNSKSFYGATLVMGVKLMNLEDEFCNG